MISVTLSYGSSLQTHGKVGNSVTGYSGAVTAGTCVPGGLQYAGVLESAGSMHPYLHAVLLIPVEWTSEGNAKS